MKVWHGKCEEEGILGLSAQRSGDNRGKEIKGEEKRSASRKGEG